MICFTEENEKIVACSIDLKSVCFRGPIEMCFVAFIAKA